MSVPRAIIEISGSRSTIEQVFKGFARGDNNALLIDSASKRQALQQALRSTEWFGMRRSGATARIVVVHDDAPKLANQVELAARRQGLRVVVSESKQPAEKHLSLSTSRLQITTKEETRQRGVDAQDATTLSQTHTAAFRAWFGNSHVVNENGEPLVVYHGTDESFDAFMDPEDNFPGRHASSGLGIFFTDRAETAEAFTSGFGGDNIIPVYVTIKKPYVMTWGEFRRKFAMPNTEYAEPGDKGWEVVAERVIELKCRLIEQGYDGILVRKSRTAVDPEGKGNSWITFNPTQIKSAIGNCGAFDPSNPDICDKPRWTAAATGLAG